MRQYTTLIALSFLLISSNIAFAEKISIPKQINGEKVHYILWQKKYSNGTVKTTYKSVRFKSKVNKPYGYTNAKTCFLNRKREAISCR